MRSTLLVLAVLLSASGCKDRKPRIAEPPATSPCTSDADCAGKWVCLAGKCTDPRPGAIYGDPANAITPDKVKRELEQTGEQHGKDVDRALDVE